MTAATLTRTRSQRVSVMLPSSIAPVARMASRPQPARVSEGPHQEFGFWWRRHLQAQRQRGSTPTAFTVGWASGAVEAIAYALEAVAG